MRSRLVRLGIRPVGMSTRSSPNTVFKPNPDFGRNMSGSTHEERTAAEQRQNAIHHVKLDKIDTVNETIRLLQLRVPAGKQIKANLLVRQCILQFPDTPQPQCSSDPGNG